MGFHRRHVEGLPNNSDQLLENTGEYHPQIPQAFLTNYRQTEFNLTTKRRGMTEDQRKHPRRPGNNQAAVVYVSAAAPPIMCTVADISEGGAGLTFVNLYGIPDQFELEIKGEPKLILCRVVWRAEPHRMGVAFISEAGG